MRPDHAPSRRPVLVAWLIPVLAAAGTPVSAQVASRTVAEVTEQGLVRVHDLRRPADAAGVAATPRVSAPTASGTSLWAYDHATALADGAALDGALAWSSWSLTGGGLRAYAIAGDGMPVLEFASFAAHFSSGIAAARGGDRALLLESSPGLDDYRVSSFTSQSEGTPDWTFQIPLEAPLGPFVSFKNVAVSRDGSTGAVALHDTDTNLSTLYVFDAATGDITRTWTVGDWMLGVDLTDDGSLALVTHTQLATVFDTASGEIVFQTAAPTFDGYYRISGDGSVLVLASNELTVLRRDGDTYVQIIHLALPESAFDASAVVSRDGSTVAAFAEHWGSNFLAGELYVYEVATGELLGRHAVSGGGSLQGNFVDAAASDDGSVLAFASWGTELEDWPEVMVFNRAAERIGQISFPGSAFAVDVSTDGRYVLAGAKAVHANEFGGGGRVELIEVPPDGNPIPVLTGLQPESAVVGSPGLTLTVQGSGFRPESTVRFGGADLATSFLDATTLTAEIPASDLDTIGVFPVTVVTPAPGGGESQPLDFEVRGAPELAFDPQSLDFGDVPVGTTSPPQTALLSNSGGGTATGLAFDPPGNGFAADTGACGDTLPAGASCEVSVTFSPPQPGPAAAELSVSSVEGAAAALSLSGHGGAGEETRLASRASGPDGVKSDNFSGDSAISANGRFVVFASLAGNLHPDDDNGVNDVFVRDLVTHQTLLVSRAAGADGELANDRSHTPTISADGRYVAFWSLATNLHPDDADAVADVFVRDLQTHEMLLVSRAGGADGVKGNGDSLTPVISGDGRYVAFQSLASNLDPDDADGIADLYVRDLDTHETLLASRASGADGVKGNEFSTNPSLSADGRLLAFESYANNLHPDDPDDLGDIFVRDLDTHETLLASRASGADGVKGNISSFLPVLAADGRRLAFVSLATNLHPDDPDELTDVFVRDLDTHETILGSRAAGADGPKGNDFSGSPGLSADGRLLVFGSSSTNLHPDDADSIDDVFLRDLEVHEVHLVSRASGSDGVKGNDHAFAPAISGSGGAIVFESFATNLHPDDGDDLPDVYVRLAGGPAFTPLALAIDTDTEASDGNGVFEPGEQVQVAPAWRNDASVADTLTGTASAFQGPDGAAYTLVEDEADYGLIEPGETASCLGTGACYRMSVDDPAVRPATHWEASFTETLSDTAGTTRTWTLHIGDSFTDVPRESLFYPWIETLLHHRVTGGCADSDYCPAAANTRGQMAVFLLKASKGGDYLPPACVEGAEVFADVPFDDLFCPWIEELAGRAVTAGCGGGNYCPSASVNRDQMAVFLLKALEGPGYAPPACTGVFTDVPCPSLFANWIEDLVARGITAGCGGGNYCPASPVSRDQMAVFLAKTFGLTLYGP